MTKNNSFRETMLILIVSYINEVDYYELDLENFEIIDLEWDERQNINDFIDTLLKDKSYIENLIAKSFGYSIEHSPSSIQSGVINDAGDVKYEVI